MQDLLADVEEDELGGFHHVGAHRPERQASAHPARPARAAAGMPPSRGSNGSSVPADRRVERRRDRIALGCRTSRFGSGWPRKCEAEQVA